MYSMSQEYFVGGGMQYPSVTKANNPRRKRTLLLSMLFIGILLIILLAVSLTSKNENSVSERAKKFYTYVEKGDSKNSYAMLSDVAKKYVSYTPWDSQIKIGAGKYKTSPLNLKEVKDVETNDGAFKLLTFEVQDKRGNPAIYKVYMSRASEESDWLVHNYSVEVNI